MSEDNCKHQEEKKSEFDTDDIAMQNFGLTIEGKVFTSVSVNLSALVVNDSNLS